MKAWTSLLATALSVLARPALVQLPAVISAPIAEDQSRKQVVHQGISTTLLGQARCWPAT
ncbi:hypothetical protein I2I05_20765 [Hymenobacter sp. BT683]|uniref:Uncharacterized protein n=1 Tax=Hymenobacter jeongseonensis TaxID=2791027 RepID=A0ABS0IP65_9BACT|nr:hypothetical protein [Hymenobacter jeongseonensis]MBF9239839.1 hypothetical protein [Hymenobacter jeongseonensis]